MSHSQNRLLASLPRAVFGAIKPDLKLVELNHGDVLAETGRPIRRVYFPHSGIISLVVELSGGDMIETAIVGRDGVIGAASALDGRISFNRINCSAWRRRFSHWRRATSRTDGGKKGHQVDNYPTRTGSFRAGSAISGMQRESHSRGPHVSKAFADERSSWQAI